MKALFTLFLSTLFIATQTVSAQDHNDELGAWYMYFFKHQFKESQWGFQGDIQYRNWNLGGDLEQLLLRGGITYTPKKANILLTLGYGNITSGAPGDSKEKSYESRIYQEALIPNKVGERFYLTHRFRYEQRFVENQDFRTRYRYNLFMNVALNKKELEHKTVYLALYNEIFINGQKNIGNGQSVELFDRNRLYAAVGYGVAKNLRCQLGIMNQTTNGSSKNQLQLSLHHTF